MPQKKIPSDQIDTGTGPGSVVQLDGAGLLPAVDGSQLTNLPGGGDPHFVGEGTPTANPVAL